MQAMKWNYLFAGEIEIVGLVEADSQDGLSSGVLIAGGGHSFQLGGAFRATNLGLHADAPMYFVGGNYGGLVQTGWLVAKNKRIRCLWWAFFPSSYGQEKTRGRRWRLYNYSMILITIFSVGAAHVGRGAAYFGVVLGTLGILASLFGQKVRLPFSGGRGEAQEPDFVSRGFGVVASILVLAMSLYCLAGGDLCR
jgi:hypothetical protein